MIWCYEVFKGVIFYGPSCKSKLSKCFLDGSLKILQVNFDFLPFTRNIFSSYGKWWIWPKYWYGLLFGHKHVHVRIFLIILRLSRTLTKSWHLLRVRNCRCPPKTSTSQQNRTKLTPKRFDLMDGPVSVENMAFYLGILVLWRIEFTSFRRIDSDLNGWDISCDACLRRSHSESDSCQDMENLSPPIWSCQMSPHYSANSMV